jgi:hypothetical protein
VGGKILGTGEEKEAGIFALKRRDFAGPKAKI